MESFILAQYIQKRLKANVAIAIVFFWDIRYL